MRKSNGRWYVRFIVDGKEYSHPTGLEATERNRAKAIQLEELSRQMVLQGKSHQLKIAAIPFDDAAKAFLEWSEGEYTARSSFLRLKSSFTSAKVFFQGEIVASIREGRIEDYKAWRRKMKVKEVSIRNDLHALSVFWQYAVRKHWARENVIEKVSIPSAAAAVRINVLSPEQERLYFDTCLWMDKAEPFRTGWLKIKKTGAVRYREERGSYRDLHDFGRIMIQQGCRPEEVVELAKEDVDLENRWLYIRSGKSKAARRRLKLTAEIAGILASRMSSDGPWVFPSPGKPKKHRGVTWRVHGEVLEAVQGKAGAMEFVPYDLRHSYATRAVIDQMPLPVLAATLGHASLKCIEKYVHITADHIDREIERIDAMRQVRRGKSAGAA